MSEVGPRSDLDGPVRRRIRVLLVRQVLEQQATALLQAVEGTSTARLHRYVADRLLLLVAAVPEPDRLAAYRLAKLGGTVYRQASSILHGKHAFADVPEVVVQEWEDVAVQVRDTVGRATASARA